MRTNRLLPLVVLIALIGWFYFKHTPQGQLDTTKPAPQGQVASTPPASSSEQGACPVLPGFLTQEALQTIKLIESDGPFPHRQDGTVFGNREGLLPSQANGYYHEYTVDTPGADNRGARRIITGGTPPTVYYYTADHYSSFRCFQVHA
ncbi:ribonuclease domain-containing protein [Pinirhizobacter soli]|uniref:ribonuclease domain-containing protein n=1 Tax=Pinirhizobacter soli TaxID=2786953 RepID=UPI00202A0236|nr:ribonuclease domain-containing protein [Pinirhizobacter soli]